MLIIVWALATPHSELMKQYEVALSRIIEMSREEENEKEGKNNVLEFEEDSEVKNVVTLSFNNTPKNKLH